MNAIPAAAIDASTISTENNNHGLLQGRVMLFPSQLQELQKRIEKLNAKAQKFGLEPISILSSKESYWAYKTETNRSGTKATSYLVPFKPEQHEARVTLHEVQLQYPIVKLGNWNVVGKLEAYGDGLLQFSATPHKQDKQRLNEAAQKALCCEHCNTARKRKEGFLLRNEETGDYKLIGSSCLEDFTGHDPQKALFLAKMSSVVQFEDMDEYFGGRSGVQAFAAKQVIALSHVLIQRHGFVSSNTSRETGIPSTAQDVMAALNTMVYNPGDQHSGSLRQSMIDSMPHAEAVIEWVKTSTDNSPYFQNLKLSLSQDVIPMHPKVMAIAVSAIPAYSKHCAAEIEKRTRSNSQHVGTPKEKMERELTIKGTYTFETQYGPSTFVTLMDDDGNVFKWKTASCPQDIHNGQGQRIRATFTIKDHGEYKGTKETSVLRLKVTEWLSKDTRPTLDEPDRPLEEHPLFPVASLIDHALQAQWPGYLDNNLTDPIDILCEYAEQACMSGDQLVVDTFTQNTSMSPSNFYQHSGEMRSVYQRIQERSKQQPQPHPSASPTFDNDNAPAPF